LFYKLESSIEGLSPVEFKNITRLTTDYVKFVDIVGDLPSSLNNLK